MALFNIDHTPAGLQGVTGALGGFLGTINDLEARDRQLAHREGQLKLAQDSAALAAEEFKHTSALEKQQVDLDAQELAQKNREFWAKLESDPVFAEGIGYLREKGQDDILGQLRADDPTQSAAAFSAIQEAAQSAALERQQRRVRSAFDTYAKLEAAGVAPPGTALQVQEAVSQGADPEVVYREAQNAVQEHAKATGKIKAFQRQTEGLRTVLANPASAARMDPEAAAKAEDLIADVEQILELGIDPELGGLQGKLQEIDELLAPKAVREKLAVIGEENRALKLQIAQQNRANAVRNIQRRGQINAPPELGFDPTKLPNAGQPRVPFSEFYTDLAEGDLPGGEAQKRVDEILDLAVRAHDRKRGGGVEGVQRVLESYGIDPDSVWDEKFIEYYNAKKGGKK